MDLPCTAKGEARVQHPDYEARAMQADEQAEQAVTREMADGWRRLAEGYRMLARQVARRREDDNRRRGSGNETC